MVEGISCQGVVLVLLGYRRGRVPIGAAGHAINLG